MAASSDPDEILRSTKEKVNFQRVARLLISGGTTLLREIFDQLCPPSNLPTTLKNPATEKALRSAKLTKPQWDCLYPSTGVYGKSVDFDVTLLFRLLRTICNLFPPSTGWNDLPASTDHSLAADLVRIKFYRNSVYGHVSQCMEITDDRFLRLWQDISEALLRIAGQISPTKKTAWKEAIDNFLKDPFTAEDERNVKELLMWYRNDVEVKKSIETSAQEVRQGMERLGRSVGEKTQDIKDQLGEEVKIASRDIESLIREEAQDIKDQLGGELKTTGYDVQSLVREEAQVMKDHLREELKSTSYEVQSLVREKAQDIKDQLGKDLKTIVQELVMCFGRVADEMENKLVHLMNSASTSGCCLQLRSEGKFSECLMFGKIACSEEPRRITSKSEDLHV